MLKRIIPLAFFSIFFLTHTNSMIMRNNALMSKMVSQFQGKERTTDLRMKDRSNENISNEPKPEKPGNGKPSVISMMQNVLCRNFPSIPCDIIMKDPTLRNLIEKSVQQIKYKTMTMEKTTLHPNYQLTLFPVLNNEDLSNFLKVRETGFFSQKNKDKPRKKAKKSVTAKNFWSHEAQPKKKEAKTSVYNGRKKIRKFYPHKIKYKDKHVKQDFGDYSDEKLSMSVEVPESHTGIKRRHFSYRNEPADPPVWRIDYMKHGEPSLNMFGYETETLKGKIIKTGPNVILDENVLEQAARRDVLHPDVYIKKNYVRKSAADMNSEDID